MGVRPQRIVVERFDATAPDGDHFTQFRVRPAPGRSFWFLLTLYNDAPFPVTVTDVGRKGVEWGPRILGARMGGTTAGDPPPRPLPYTIAPHDWANLHVHVGFRGCLDESASTLISSVPLSFRMFDAVDRRTEVRGPLTIEILGAPGTHC